MLRHFFCIISFVPWLFSKQPHRHSCMASKHWEYHASAFQCLLNRNFKSLKHNALMSNTYMIEQYLNRAIPKPIQSKNSRTQDLKERNVRQVGSRHGSAAVQEASWLHPRSNHKLQRTSQKQSGAFGVRLVRHFGLVRLASISQFVTSMDLISKDFHQFGI